MATNGVVASYQEIVDLHTEANHVTVLGIHTPTGDYPSKMFSGFFDQYKKYKYLGCSISLVPAARLPADPLQISYEAGQVEDTFMDPRDALNPILFHGCHGDDMGTILNRLYGDDNGVTDSIVGVDVPEGGEYTWDAVQYELLERLYYKALTDNTWKKAHPQRGFRKSGLRPLVYDLSVNRQIMPGTIEMGLDTDGDLPFGLGSDGSNLKLMGGDSTSDYAKVQTSLPTVASIINKKQLQFFTPRLKSLGWMDTRNTLTRPQSVRFNPSTVLEMGQALTEKAINYAQMPKLFMGCIMLPPAYGVEQYYRMIINHRFAFKNFRGISFKPEVSDVPTYWDKNEELFGLEVGHFNEIDTSLLPTDSVGSDSSDLLTIYNNASTAVAFTVKNGSTELFRFSVFTESSATVQVPAGIDLVVSSDNGVVWTRTDEEYPLSLSFDKTNGFAVIE